MSTSLAEQLQRLAVPQTSIFKQDTKKPSLLFDQKQAAELTRAAFYQIGLDGFEELKEKNLLFTQFGNTLFHITSTRFERSVQDVSANERLDKEIKKFFLILSPYFLLSCAHKALEWLINRYSIHEYNRKDLLMLILPYHETNIFVRILQLIKIKDTGDTFIWLKKLQKAGVHLPKNTLYNYAANNPQLLKEIAEFIFEAIKEHDKPYILNVLFNFYSMTFTGALDYSKNISEIHMSHMLSTLLKGQKSTVPDFCAGSYIVTAKLLSKTELSEKILIKFVNNISVIPLNSLKVEAILLLVIVYQTQKHLVEIPDTTVQNLVQKSWIPKMLQQLASTNNFIEPFLEALFKGSIKCGLIEVETNVIKAFVSNLFNEIKLEDSFISKIINFIVDVYNPKGKDINDSSHQWIRSIISLIETQYPTAFDKEVNSIMSIQPGSKLTKRQKRFQKLVLNYNGICDNISLFSKLYHPVADVRRETIKLCIKKYMNLKEREQECIKNAILDRLNDENPDVVLQILCQSKKLLTEIIDRAVLKNILIKLLKKSYSNEREWWKICYPSLSILCNISDEDDISTFIVILPFLLPLNESEMNVARLIVNSSYFSSSKYLQCLDSQLKKASNCEIFFNIVFNNLKSIKLNIHELIETFKSHFDNESVSLKYIFMLFLFNLVPQNSTVNVSSQLLDILFIWINNSNVKLMNIESVTRNCLKFARQKNKFPLQGILDCIEILIQKSEYPTYNLGLCNFSISYDVSKFYIQLLNLLLTGCYTTKYETSLFYAKTLKKFLNHTCSDIKSVIEFLLNIAVAENENISPLLQMRSVRTAVALIGKKQEDISIFVKLDEVIVPYIIVGMSSKFTEIRMCMLNIVELILSTINLNEDNNYLFLLKNILNYKEEIILDEEQISVIINNIFEKHVNLKAMKISISSLMCLINNNTYPLYLRATLANILISIDDFEIHNKIAELGLEILENSKGFQGELHHLNSHILYNILKKLDADNSSKVTLFSNIYKVFNSALHNDLTLIKHSNISVTPSALSITHIDRDIFENFKSEVKLALLNTIIEIATISANSDVLTAAANFFKHIDLDAVIIIKQMTEMYEIQSLKIDATKQKRRISIIPTADILETMEWKKGITILEFLQDKKKLRNAELLISLLFKILKKCLDFDEQSSVEYPKQLILSSILNCCAKMEVHILSENTFNVELVVQCIRASQNPQTHHHALLVLVYIANLIPKQVLHHIMAIFTFMGSSVLRHDDAYSFQIITKIIDTIIPILIEDNSLENIVSVLRVFVDAILDVPEHRRMILYQNLLEKINAHKNLYLFLLLMIEAHVLHANAEKQKLKETLLKDVKKIMAPKRLDIAADISRKFSSDIVIENCIQLIKYLRMLPEEKESVTDKINLPFNIIHQTPKQYRHFKYVIITFVSNLLSSKEFVHIIASLSDKDQQELETLYKNMIISIITYIQCIVKISDKNNNTPQAQYWKVMLHHSYDVLDCINALLTPQMFLLVIRGLTTHNLNAIRRRALELLNTKLQYDTSFFNDCSESEMYAVIPALLNIVKENEAESTDQELVIQTAFLSLKLLIRHLAKENPEKFVQVLDFVTNLIKSGKTRGNILASAILCLAELCTNLRAYTISNLNKFMPAILKILKIHRSQDCPDLLLLSAITAVLKVIECLPLFLSPYLEKLLYELSLMMTKWHNIDDNKLQCFVTKLVNIRQKIGNSIPSRVLIPIIHKTYDQLIEHKNSYSIGALMNILAEKLSHMETSEIQSNVPELTTFFLNTLQLRADKLTSLTETNEIEKQIINALLTFILKLSESTFRPLYYKIYDWAVRHDVKNERIITFYSLSSSIASSLKGLFVLFAGHFLSNAALVLDLCNVVKQQEIYFEDTEKTIMLLEYVLKTLNTVCLYDTQKFVNKERFDILMQPLVDQLENTLGNENTLIARADALVIPCIVQFSIATGDDALWKQVNYQVLLKMRHSSANIRLIALKCVLQLASKLGEDFLSLLPETIPFLAELLEDEDENVEKICQKTVQELEKVLGEPLQKYF